MKDRLQFRHHDAIFNTREDAINYIKYDIRFSENGLSKDDVKQLFSLYAEPTVLRYKNADDESNPHIILAIGSKSNQVEGAQYSDNKFCFIDIDKTEDEIEALGDKLKNAITSLEIFTRDTSTLSLSVDKNESGETLSGNVKVPATDIINGTVTNNTLKVTENGIFTYVNLNYDKDTDKLTFTVNGDTKEWNVNNDYITGGTYSIKDESLHLGMHGGKEIVIPFEELINEWDVEGEDADSPIVLTREKVLYEDDKVVDHRHGNRWQDTLKADVRIAKIPHNILNRTEDGKALYVKGTAGNIKFFKDGKEMTVADALVECANKKLSTDNDNMIYERPDGYFAMSRLTYDAKENTLTFTTSNQSGGTTDEKIELNSIKIIDDARYDRDTESLIFTYTTAKGEYKKLVVPVGSLIDEWVVNNDGHNVILKKERKSNVDKDILSADVRVSSLDNNILVEKGDGLYVNGEAKNIKYGDNSSVEHEISAAKESIVNEIERAKKAEKEASDAISNVVATIGSGFTTDTHETVTCKVEQLDNAIKSKVSSVGKIDNSVVVDVSDANNPKVGVKLSSDKRDEKIPNLIELHENGLFAAVDLSYDESRNSLTFTTTNGSKTIKLAMNSFVDNIYYDASREVIVIEYTVNGKKMPNVEVPVRTLINEWTVSDNTDGAVKLKKTVNNSGASDNNKDILSAEVIIDKNHGDNMLINDNGALYVSSGIVKEVASKLDKEIERATKKDESLENKIDEATLGFSSTTSVNVDANDKKNIKLSTKISNSNNNLITIDSVKEGLYVTASVKYDNAKNELQLLDANQNVISHTKLGSGSIIESITYDKNGKNLVITYKNSDGEKFEINVPVEDLFNEWNVDNKSEGSALELKKVVIENGSDLLSGKVLLATGKTDNMIQIVGNGLYVSSSDIKQNTANIAEVTEKVNTLKTDFDAEKARSTAKDAEQDRNIEALSGKSASSDAIIKENTQAISDINSSITELKQKDIDLSKDLNAEVTRASNAEDNLNKAISAETKAREDAESEIKADIETNRNAIDAASKSIASETNRATSAETALKTSIDSLKHSLDDTNASLTNEVAKITAVTSTLATNLENEVTRSSNEDRRLSDSLTTEANRAQSAETSISNSLTAEVTRATNIENAIKSDLVKEVSDRKSSDEGFKEDIKKINSGNTAISGAVTSLESKINSEIQRSKDADNSHSEKIKANTDLVNSTKNALDAEVTRATNAELTNKDALTAEITRAKAEEASISNSLAAEVTRASNAEDNLNKAITAETKAREDAEKVIKADIEANKLKFADSTSVSLLRSDATSPNTVKASVKISNAPKNLLSLSNEAEGLFANVSLSYNAATNTLSVIGSDGHSSISDVKLGVGSIVDSITYDSAEKALVITYTDSTGSQHSTKANVEDLFNEWEPDSDANNVAIELIKHNNGIKNDVLTAKVRVSAEDDNIIKIKDNMLYASNAPIVKNATDITALSGDVKTITANVTTLSGDSKNNLNELRNLEKATLGLISPVGVVEYTPHEDAHLISAATSMNSADVILDNKLFEVCGKVTTVEATLDLNSKELKKVEKVIGVTGNGDNDIAYPKNGHGIIDGAATYADADEKLEKALVDVKTLTSGALTPTANLHVDGVDSDKKLQVDVRLSHGKGSTMTDENLTITSTDSPEFSEENALRKIALSGEDVTSAKNGLFLSSTWNCGEYDRDERPESMDIFDRLFDNSKRQ